MTPQEAVASVYQGIPIDCTEEEWPPILRALQDAAARWIDEGDSVRAGIALSEARLGCRSFPPRGESDV